MGGTADQIVNVDERTHLFISYATEDHELADWLALHLAAEGYEVWYDRIKLLGGESYPNDIDDALKNKTFRVLHLLSRHSKDKANPVKERTAALNIGREREVDFLIPLNIDGLTATELPWMTADLTYIPFNGDWAGGLSKLLKKLNSLNAPKRLTDGRGIVRNYFADQQLVQQVPEPIWSNVIEFVQFPESIYRITPRGSGPVQWQPDPIFFPHSGGFWAFEKPAITDGMELQQFSCDPAASVNGLPLRNAMVNLIAGHLIRYGRQKGLKFTGRRGELYFPAGVTPNDRLSFQVPGHRSTWTAATGQRTFIAGHSRDKSRYHLAFELRPVLHVFEKPVIEIQMAVWLADLSGHALEPDVALRRRKRICRDWWNHEWLSRTFAALSWLADGQETFEVFRNGEDALVVSGRPFVLQAPVRLDESQLESVAELDDNTELDDSWDLVGDSDDSSDDSASN